MKILLAPSETKKEGGEGEFNINSLIFPQITPQRELLINKYLELINSGSINELKEIFGLKKEEEIKKFAKDITKEPVMKAIMRYTGVAFDYIDYNSLDRESQKYIDENVLIFSNLFGVLKADDKIPLYKLKQGAKLKDTDPKDIYKTALKEPLDNYLQNEDILDIRAGYYDKFYKPTKSYTTLKFIKNGKVVSHWAKAYRGLVLREIALNKIDNIKDFIALEIENLELLEIRESKQKQEIIYEISED